MKQTLKQWLRVLAPESSRRFALLNRCLHWIARPRYRALGTQPLDVYDATAFNAFLLSLHQPPLEASVATATDLNGCRRLLLTLLQARPDLRARFPTALSSGSEGAFACWLTDANDLDWPAAVVQRCLEALQTRPAPRIRLLCDHHRNLWALVPLVYTPAGRRGLAYWLLRKMRTLELSVEEIWWFLFELAEDPAQGIGATFLLQPEWQRRFPHGLTVYGWEALRNWLRNAYAIADPWLDQAVRPTVFTPEDELRLLALAEPCRAKPTRAGVNVLAHFCYPSGLSVAADAAVRALGRVGMPVSCRDVPANWRADVPQRDNYLGLEVHDQTVILMAPEPLLSTCYERCGLARRAGVQHIAVWYWELETAPPRWARHGRWLDEVWAPTRFIADALAPIMPIPVMPMLPGVELSPFTALPRRHFDLPEDRFLFLFAFDMCSVMERKNPLALIEAFQQAFRNDKRVALAIKVTRGDSDPQNRDRLLAAARAAGVQIIDRVMTRAESYALIASCDCYISLHRSEGFGLTMAEAMLLGKPVISTAYSGNLDFMNADNSLLVNYERQPITQALPIYGKGACWAEPSVAHAAELMRQVYNDQALAHALGVRARADLQSLLSLDAAGQRMADRLRLLSGARTSQRRAG